MSKRLILKAIVVDDNDDNELSGNIISIKNIICPTDSSNFGYNQEEQLLILSNIQQVLIDNQAVYLNKKPEHCPCCSSHVRKNGKYKSQFCNLYSDNEVKLQSWRCSKKNCKWSETSSITKRLSGNIHIDLIKVQAELGSRNTYRQAENNLKSLAGKKRKIHNKSRIQRTTKIVGTIIQNKRIIHKEVKLSHEKINSKKIMNPEYNKKSIEINREKPSRVYLVNKHLEKPNVPINVETNNVIILTHSIPDDDEDLARITQATTADKAAVIPDPAQCLYIAIDGGHVHDADNKGHNFEAMIAKLYRPENVIRVDKNHTKIIKKHCAGSSRNDCQETMKNNVIEAAIKEGIDPNITELTVLADGAKNCWNIAKSLVPFCLIIIYILDWFHIGKYIENLKKQLPHEHDKILNDIKEKLWFGKTDDALDLAYSFKSTLEYDKHIKKIGNFIGYIDDNKARIVNYNDRKSAGLIYSSHVAESSVEHLINERSKRKQKMQWSRDGLHAVLQIRSSQASNEWENDWENIILPTLKSAK